MLPRSVLLFALVASGAVSVPIDVRRYNDDASCAATCTESGKFRYEPGKTYEFTYETRTKTGIEGASEDKSTLIIMATVDVRVMSQCEFVLKMDDVRLLEIDPENPSKQIYSPSTREFKERLEANPLRFGFQDGRIESVCPSDDDATWILNIKRGFLSTFQNAMVSLDRDQRVTETDISGDCDAEYKVETPSSRWSAVTTLRKTKNLLACVNRHGYNSAIQAIPYHVQSDIQSLPLMKSMHDCEQKIDGGKLISATCRETHLFRPFAKGSNGAVTDTTQKVTFNREKSHARQRPDFISRRSDLHFEHEPVEGADSADKKQEAETRLQKLCRLTREDIRPETPQLFAELVHLMRDLDSDSLRDIYRRVQSNSFCSDNAERTRKFFLDAIPMVGTKASVGMIEDFLSKGIIQGIEADVWITSLAFIPNPKRTMLAEIKPLLRNKPSGHVMLSVSALVNNFCQKNDCENDMDVESIVSLLSDNLGSNCAIQGNDAEKILLSLRAIGNTGHALNAVPTLNRCLANDALPMEIRLSAVNAFRHISCKADRNNIMALLRNSEEDSELRIAAYLAVMECPTTWVLEQVKETLEAENVNQVGSFIWTHLTNLMETSDPHKQAIRGILEDETLEKEFDMDKRKFSRNYEGSVFVEKINTGAKAESNLIWSSKSFLPRSAMVNLTVDLFGHAVNLIEIGGRVEGLEYYLESLFGPEGNFMASGDKAKWRRSKREVVRRDKLDRIKQRYGITSDELAGSMYFRMFGNELGYLSMGGPARAKKGLPNIMDILLKLAKDQSYHVTQNIMFMDSSIVIPTAIGLPLKLTVNGTASIDLQVSGKMDVTKLSSRPTNMHIEGVVQPSGAVQIASSMVIDAFVLRSGLKMVSTLHSSTASNGKIEIKDGQIFNVEFDSPREKMEIINLETKFFVLHREAEREQKMIEGNRKDKQICSGKRLAKLTGLEICGSIGFTNASHKEDAPYFPMTGPLSLGINIFKRDSHSGYVFSAKTTKDSSRAAARIAFDTPGSRENRKLVADFELDIDNMDVKLELESPWKSATVKGSMSIEDGMKKAVARLSIDKQEYVAKGEVRINRSGKRTKYVPLLELSAPRSKPMTIGGAVEVNGDEAVEIDLSTQNIFQRPINLRSTIVFNDEQKSFSGSFTKGKDIYRAESKLLTKKGRGGISYNASIHVQCPERELIKANAVYEETKNGLNGKIFIDKIAKDPIILAGSWIANSGRRNSKRLINVDVKTPLINFDVNGNIAKKSGGKQTTTSKLIVNYQIPKSGRDRVTLSSKMRNLSTKSLSKYDVTINGNFRKFPMYNFETKSNIEYSITNLDSSFELTYGDNPKDEDRKITFIQSGTNKLVRDKRDGSLKINLKYPLKGINYQVKGTHHMTNKDLNTNIIIRYGSGDQVDANVQYNNDMDRKNKFSGEVGLSYPGRRLKLTSDVVKVSPSQYNNTMDIVWGKGGKAKIESTYTKRSDISDAISSTINVAQRDPVVIAGSINRDLKDFEISSRIDIGKKKYGAAALSKASTRKYEGQLDLEYPDRHIIADVSGDWGNKYSGEVDLKWDAGKDKAQRLKANGDLRVRGLDDIRGSLQADVLDRKIEANIRHQGGEKYVSHADIKYAPGKKIELDTTYSDVSGWSNRKVGGSLQLTSPLQYAEYIAINAEHNIDSLQYESTADIAWSRSDKVAGTVTVKRPISSSRLESSLAISTPFRDMSNIKAEINHRINDGIATFFKAEVGRHNMDINLKGSTTGWDVRKELSGDLVIQSSIPDYERVALKVSHSSDGRKYDSDLSADIGTHGRYTANLDYTLDGYTFINSNEGKFVITTPIRNYNKIVTAWSHRLRQGSIDSTVSCSCGKDRLALSVEAKHIHSYHQRLIQSNIKFETPLRPIRELVLTVNHDHSLRKLESSASLIRNRIKKTEFTLYHDMDGDYNIESRAMFVCPGLHEISAKFNTKLSDTPQTAEVEVEWSPSDKVTLSGELAQHGLQFIDGTLRLTTPVPDFERIVLTGHHAKEDGIWASRASLEYAPRREIEVRTKYAYAINQKIIGEISVTAPFYQFQKFKVGVEHSGDIRRATNSKAQFELVPQVGLIEAIANSQNDRQKTGSLRINTPFRAIPHSELKVAYLPGSVQTELEYLPGQIVNINAEYRLENPRDLFTELIITTPISSFDFFKTSFIHRGSSRRSRSVVKVEYPRREEFSATMNYENDDKIEASLDLKAPQYDDVRLSVSHNGTPRDFNSRAELTYQRNQKIEGDVIFSLKRGGKGPIMSLESVAKSPLTRDFNLKLTHEGNIVDFKTNLITSYGRSNNLNYNLGFSTLNDNIRANTNVNLKCEYIDPIQSSANFNLKGELKDFKGNFDGSYKGKSVDASVSCKVTRGIEASITLETPFQIAQRLMASLKHRGDFRQFTTNAKVQHNRDDYETDLTYSTSNSGVDGNVTIKTPFRDYRELTGSLLFKGDLKKMDLTSKILYADGKEIDLAGGLDLISERRKFEIVIHTPFRDFETISASGNVTGKLSNFDLNGHVQYATNNILGMKCNLDLENTKKVVSVTVSTPFNRYERLAASIKADGDLNRFTVEGDLYSGSADVTYLNNKRITFSSSASLEGNPKSASADIKTPFQGFEDISFVANFNGYAQHFKADSRVTYGRRENIELDVNVDLEGRKRAVRASIKTPFDGFENLSGKLNFNGIPTRFDGDAEIQYSTRQKIEAKCSLDVDSSPKSISLSAKTPFRGWEDQSASASINGELKRCEIEARVSYGLEKTVTFNGALDVISSTKTLNGRITSPYPGYETQALAINVDGSPLNFQSSVTVESSQMHKPVLARASLGYLSPTKMDATFTFASSIRNAESLKLSIKNDNNNRYTSSIEATWAPRKTISLNGNFERSSKWSRTEKTAGDISLSTPFKYVKKFSTSFEDIVARSRRKVALNVDYENNNIISLKANREAEGKVSVDVDMPHPRPMKFHVDGKLSSDSAEGSIEANWNARDPTSNFKITSEYKDNSNVYSSKKSVSFNVIRPETTVGISGSVENSAYKKAALVEMIVDNKRVSIGGDFSDISQGYTKIREGNLRVNTPYRIVKLAGSHSDSVEKMVSEMIVSWDAERDESKKVILSSAIEKSSSSLKTDFKLEAPSIRKEIRLTSEGILNRGRTWFDGKAELSYSPDRRKKVAITTRIEDTSSGRGDNSNISIAVGLSHPYTNTDLRIASHAGKTDDLLSAGVEIYFLKSRDNLRLRGEIDRIRKEAKLEIISPAKSVQITGRLRTDDGYQLSLHNVYDNSKTIDTNVVIRPDKGNIAISMGTDLNDPRNTINLQAGYVEDNIFSVEAFHVSRYGRETDGLVTLTLNTSRILHTRLHWRPSVLREIKSELDRRSSIYQGKIIESLRESPDDLVRQLSGRARAISSSIVEDITPFVDLLEDASKSLDMELARLLDELNRRGLKEVLATAQKALDDIMKFADEVGAKALDTYERAARKVSQALEEILTYEEIMAVAQEYVQEIYYEAQRISSELIRKAIDQIERQAESASYVYARVENESREIARQALKKMIEILDRFSEHPTVIRIREQVAKLVAKLPNIPKTVDIKTLSRQFQNTVKNYQSSIGNKYMDMVNAARQKVTQHLQDLMQREEVKHAHAVANEIYQQGKWAYNYWDVERNSVELVKSLLNNIRELLMEEAKELRDSLLNMEKSHVIVYDPREGEIQFEIYLPIALKSLRALPDDSIKKYVKAYRKFANSYIPSSNFSLADAYYTYKPSSDIYDWIPPFKAHASVSGIQHFTTFDGRQFEFAGLCSYVLVHDFMDGNFSVILNYDVDRTSLKKRSLSITAGEKRIDIFPDFKVQVDSRPQDLPYMFEAMTVTRQGGVIMVDSGNGLQVECDLIHDVYTVTLSGWFFGKTAGLFGTYDNEPSNDMIMSTLQTSDDIESFAHSWEVAGSCRSRRNFAKNPVIEAGRPGFSQCQEYFMSTSSPFRHCFRQIVPEGAMARCMVDFLMNPTQASICNSSAQYIQECQMAGVPMSLPSMCVGCRAPNGDIFQSGDSLLLSGNEMNVPRSADVIFVVEEKECNKEAASDIQALAEDIDTALSAKKLLGNRFGIVGFGGSSLRDEVHSQTIDGQIMNDVTRFGIGVESMMFDKKVGVSDVLEAVKFATDYPWRTGVSKILVLMPCSSCLERSTDFEEVKAILTKQGITLHLLMKHDFEFRSNRSPKSGNVGGVDNNGAFAYLNRGDNMNSDSSLLTELRVPKENCMALTQISNGSFFNLARLIEGRRKIQKAFRLAWSNSIGESAEPMSCQECKCVANEYGMGVSTCSRCDQSTMFRSASQYPIVPRDDDFETQFNEYLFQQ